MYNFQYYHFLYLSIYVEVKYDILKFNLVDKTNLVYHRQFALLHLT